MNNKEAKEFSKSDVIKQLNAMDRDGDNEIQHGNADYLLIKYLEFIGEYEVADAWKKAKKRCGFWYA